MDDIDDETFRELFESEPWPQGGDRIGPYVLDTPFSTVLGGYFANGDDGRVVLKTDFLWDERRITTVLAAVRALAHPNILTVHAGGRFERLERPVSRVHTAEIGWIAVTPYGETFRRWSPSRPWTTVLAALCDVATTLAAAEVAGLGDCVPYDFDICVGPDLGVRVDVAAGLLRADSMRNTTSQVAFTMTAWMALRGGYPPRREHLADIPLPRGADLPAWVLDILERGAYGPPWPSMAALAAALEPASHR